MSQFPFITFPHVCVSLVEIRHLSTTKILRNVKNAKILLRFGITQQRDVKIAQKKHLTTTRT